MVAGKWGWDIAFMFTHFGWKAIVGITVATLVYGFVLRKEFASLKEKADAQNEGVKGLVEEPIPMWITLVVLGFMGWTVFNLHNPPLFIAGFLFFMAFVQATATHQDDVRIKGPLLVGFFLAGLVTHGALQQWWIAPVLSQLGELSLFTGATVLTAFNDNAAITFLASQVPEFSPTGGDVAIAMEYAVVAGAVTGGGLTVIANAPNPAGQSLLSRYFDGGISPGKLFLGALFPTLVMALSFMIIR
jgi:Na+/H+ antiporter NhaD/arsenite permease-like protein